MSDDATLVREGTSGIRARAGTNLARYPEDSSEAHFLRAVDIACEGLERLAAGYARVARAASLGTTNAVRRAELEQIAEDCEQVPRLPARSFQAQIALNLESLDNAVSPGRLDRILAPLYDNDRERGALTRESAFELLGSPGRARGKGSCLASRRLSRMRLNVIAIRPPATFTVPRFVALLSGGDLIPIALAALAGCEGGAGDDGQSYDASSGTGEDSGAPQCAPGETRPAGDGCNDCWCDQGKWMCSLVGCCYMGETKPMEDGCGTCWCEDSAWSCHAVSCSACQPGMTQSPDGCNACVCQADATWSCGTNPCRTCEPGGWQRSPDGCNECFCSSSKRWVCTAVSCQGCAPGATKKSQDGCDTCECRDDGTWNCPDGPCPEPCSPGAVMLADDRCNTCTCSAEGKWACTTTSCDGPCAAGDSRPAGDDCNTCYCTAQGSWACTAVVCSPE